MTIKEAAAHYGVSTQAIYQRIAKAGKKSKDITNRENGELTEEGADLLATWFTNSQPVEVESSCKHCKELQAQIDVLTATNATLQSQIDTLERDKDRLYMLLAQEQKTTQALTAARLTAPEQKKTPPLWQRMKTFVIGDKEG